MLCRYQVHVLRIDIEDYNELSDQIQLLADLDNYSIDLDIVLKKKGLEKKKES